MLKNRIILFVFCLILIFDVSMIWAAAVTGKVFQGTCVSFNESIGEMVLKNDKNEQSKNPIIIKDGDSDEVTFQLKEAILGVRPASGDLIRVGFVERDGKLFAHKIQNVTKQNIFKK